jgi:predicted PurR-regulated permease PerM
MLLYVVIAFGLLVSWQLWGISQQLESNHSAMQKLFAHELREWLEEIPKDIVEELQGYKDGTFAQELRERLDEISNLKESLEEISKDITGEVQAAARDILNTLSTIEDNTSHD